MKATPKSLRLHIGIYGRTNTGKSSFLNMISGQDVSITSPVAGTTTDVVEKAMELLPLGPVLFLDTAGLDDGSELAVKRTERARSALNRTDIAVIVSEASLWGEFEENLLGQMESRKIPVIVVLSKADVDPPSQTLLKKLGEKSGGLMVSSSAAQGKEREKQIARFKEILLALCPDDFLQPPPLIGDLLPREGVAVLLIPIDIQAPRGRLILPQVQTIRDGLDHGCIVVTTKENAYRRTLASLNPDLVVCDSQIVDFMIRETPETVGCTTFSILQARQKMGNLELLTQGALQTDNLKPGDRILIAEACTHHALEEDIGRVKIPKWLKAYLGFSPEFEVCSGKDYPEDLHRYGLIVHCGGCMLSRKELLWRTEQARAARIPITNYGLLISQIKGVLRRVTAPFPELGSCRTARETGR